jgi:4-amino-4-deoxy-L-arabinose transferase-like glycosyltransferase
VQAGTKSWKAFFFGSLDASNFITVDKPPFSLWMMELSARIFGFHAWSMLLPDILAGVGTVAIVYASVRRWFSANSALLAAGVMALTPIAVVMFGFDNPDGILTLLLAGSAYAMLRALENVNPLRWLSIAAVLTCFAFTTKMLQGLIVLPVLAAVYLICAKPRFLIRLKHLLLASIPLIIFTLWWPVLVSVTPVNDRPYIGSSGNNSIWSLIVGYNGFGRLLGTSSGMGGANGKHGHSTGFNLSTTTKGGTAASQTIPSFSGTSFSGFPGSGGKTGGFAGAGHGGPGGSGFGGSVGVLRIFNSDFGPNIGWYIPAGLISTAFVLWQRRKKARTDRVRAAFLLWSGYVVLHIIVFSLVSGVIHPYYPVVMAPAIAALIGMGAPILFDAYKRRTSAALVLPAVVALTGIVAAIMLDYEPLWFPELRIFILIASIISALGLIVHLYFPKARLSQLSLIIACIACCAGPVAYSLDSVTVTHTGSIPSAGPSGTGMAGSNNETASVEKSLATYLEQHRDGAAWIVAVNSANESAPIQLTTGEPVMAVGGFDGSDTAISLKNFEKLVSSGKLRYYAVSTGKGLAGGGFNRGGRSVILDWVEAHSSKVSYGGTDYTLYKLSV